MEQKHQFVSLAATGRFTFTELCADFRVSRKTGHKWVVRYRQDGAAGLRERSRRPHGCAHQTALRIAHPAQGPRFSNRLEFFSNPAGNYKITTMLRMAEGEGFEPPEPCGSAVFKTAAIDHSATLPIR